MRPGSGSIENVSRAQGGEHERGVASFGATATATGGSGTAVRSSQTVADNTHGPTRVHGTGSRHLHRLQSAFGARVGGPLQPRRTVRVGDQSGARPQAAIDARGSGTIETTPRRRSLAGRWRMHAARQRRTADFAARIRPTPVAERGLWPAASAWLFVARPATATSPSRSGGAGG